MMNLALPGLETETVRADDIILTPDDVARDVVARFRPSGRVLDPCKGEGAFLRHMPGAEWCEIREGRDFFGWTEPVDWIVSNPPYSIFSDFLRHAFRVAQDIVFLIPVNKAFNSDRMMREIWAWGGIPTVYVVGGGGALGFPIGFCIGAVHFRRGYRDGMRVEFRIPNARPHAEARSADSVQADVRCADCGRMVPRLEATEQTTFEGTHVRCETCGDAAYERSLQHHGKRTPNASNQAEAGRR